MQPQVQDVKTRGDDIYVTFSDGHVAVFEPYSHGFGYQVEGLRHFMLRNGSEEVFTYDARLHYAGPQKDEHQVRFISDRYTLQQIVDYWGTARKHINEEYFEKPYREGTKGPEELWYPWKVTGEGWIDLDRLREQASA